MVLFVGEITFLVKIALRETKAEARAPKITPVTERVPTAPSYCFL